MAYSVIDKVYTIFIDVMTGSSNGYGKPTFYNTDSHTSFIELTVTNGSKEFNMTEFSYMFTVEKPDGTKYTNEYTTQDKSKLVIPVDAQMISCTGNCNAQLYVNKEVDGVNKTLTMVEFNYTVYKGLHEGLISESVDFDNVYVKILNKLDYIINNGADLTGDQAAQLSYAYQHSKSPHAPANIVETMHTEIGEAIDAHHKKVALSASQVGSYEGTDITIKPSNEGLTKDIVIKGRTMQNIFPSEASKFQLGTAVTIQEGMVTISPTVASYQNAMDVNNPLYKPNAAYTIVVDIYSNTLVKAPDADTSLANLVIGNDWNNQAETVFEGNFVIEVANGAEGRYTKSIRTQDNFDKVKDNNGARMFLSNAFNGGSIKFSVMILEGDLTQEGAYIPPYFEGIKSVGEPKNLFNKDTAVRGWVGSNGEIAGIADDAFTSDFIPVEPNTTYVKSAVEVVGFYDSDKRFISRKSEDKKFTSPENAKYMRVTGKPYSELNKFQVEKGFVETIFEPYFEEGTSLVRIGSYGKNLVNLNERTHQSTQITISNKKANEITLESNLNNGYIYISLFDTVASKNSDYVVGCKFEKIIDGKYCSLKVFGNTTNDLIAEITEDGYSVINTKDNEKLQIYLYTNRGTNFSGEDVHQKIRFYDIMMAKGTDISTYEPYQEDIKEITANISDGLKGLPHGVNDYLYTNNNFSNHLWLAQIVGSKTYSGDEAWEIADVASGSDVNNLRFQVAIQGAKDAIGQQLVANYPSDNLGTHYWDIENIQIYRNTLYVRIKKDRLETQDAEGFKKWLGANPLTVCYPLAEAKYTEVLTSNGNLKTYEGATHVFSKHDFKPTISFSTDFILLTTDAKQYCTADGNKNFILPDVSALEASSAVEIHLFVKITSMATLSFPSEILWDDSTKLSNIVQGSVAEFIFTYIKTADGNMWVGTVVPHK